MSTHSTGPEARPAACGEPWVEDPRLLPLLPMIYVAWADGDLTETEVARIRRAIDGIGWLDAPAKRSIEAWLDPSAPPSVREMQCLLRTVREAASALAPDARLRLVDLGLEIAKVRAPDRAEGIANAETRAALERVEEALGVVGAEAARELIAAEPGRRPRGEPVRLERPTFDVAAMTRLLDEPHADVRRSVFALLAQPGFEHPVEIDRARHREMVLGWVRRLAEAGLGALAYPGVVATGKDLGAFIAAFETLAYFDLSLLVKFGVQFGLFGGSIYNLGTRPHHERYLARVASGELLGCFAMTELGHGSNVRDVGTTARFDRSSGEFVIHTPAEAARKDFIGNAARDGRLATVFAQLEADGEPQGVHAFLVPLRDERGRTLPGVRIEDCGPKMGLDGIDNGRIWFENVRVPRENLLDRFGHVGPDGTYSSPNSSPSKRFFTMIGTLVGGRVSVACAALSVAKSALAIAVRYASCRRQFGPAGRPEVALLDYRSHEHRLLRPLAMAYALHFGLRHLVRRYVGRTEEDSLEVESLAAGLKAASTRFATDTIQACREACGGQGYLAANRFAALKADSDVFMTFEGDNTVLLQLVARGLLTHYQRQFSNLSFRGIVRYLAEEAARTVAELNPIAARRTDEAHLRDRGFQLEALRHREQHLLGSVARRLKKRLDAGMDSFEAFNECQLHALALARAHVERLLLERFQAAIEACEEAELRPVLSIVCDLFALDRLDQDAAWFLECGIFESGKARAIRKLAERLSTEVRAHALPLVNSFAIPDRLLAAPIAFTDHFTTGG